MSKKPVTTHTCAICGKPGATQDFTRALDALKVTARGGWAHGVCVNKAQTGGRQNG